ncbi:MAG TPA: amidohydrolase family protein [Actinomycetota bacterium]|jgi:imidazolonepropionase-like amidohydrolase
MARLAIRAPLAWLGPGRATPDVQVTCEGGSIVEVGRIGPVRETDELIAVDGFLMPAGADRHVHVGLGDPVAIVRRGVTAVRDLAWPSERIFPLAEASEMPGFNGPLIRAAGPMLTAPGGYPTLAPWAPDETGMVVDDGDGAAAAVAELAERGAVAIKVSLNADAGPTPSDAVLAAICDAAAERDLPVTAHAQGAGQVVRALGAGVGELAHTPWSEPLDDGTIVAAAKRQRWVSTLDIHGFGRDTPELRCALDNLARFHRAGGEVVYGTDLGNGPIPSGVHVTELRWLRAAGLKTEECLEAFVRAPIEVGAPADLLVVGESPLGDIAALDDIRLVVRAGEVVAEN